MASIREISDRNYVIKSVKNRGKYRDDKKKKFSFYQTEKKESGNEKRKDRKERESEKENSRKLDVTV